MVIASVGVLQTTRAVIYTEIVTIRQAHAVSKHNAICKLAYDFSISHRIKPMARDFGTYIVQYV